jgi:hypothetical protein
MNVEMHHSLACSRSVIYADIEAVGAESHYKVITAPLENAENAHLLLGSGFKERAYVTLGNHQCMPAGNGISVEESYAPVRSLDNSFSGQVAERANHLLSQAASSARGSAGSH